MSYLYQGLAGSKFTTRCSPRTYEERETAIRKNIEWETGGIARGVERYRNEPAVGHNLKQPVGRHRFRAVSAHSLAAYRVSPWRR